jgi:hypothetical protein
MPKLTNKDFDPLILPNKNVLPISTLGLDKSERLILWTLGREGELSIYDLRHGEAYRRSKRKSVPIASRVGEQKAKGKEESLWYSVAHKKVESLESKGLVTTTTKMGVRDKRMVELTFSGLTLYLRGSADKDRVKNALDHYSKLIPFFSKWKEMCNEIGEKNCIKELERTAVQCANLLNAKFYIGSPSLEFPGFLRNDSPLNSNRISKVRGFPWRETQRLQST